MENNRNHTDQYWAFRKQYPEFIYKSYEVCETEAELKVTYHFQITGLAEFAPTWRFPKPQAAEGVSVTEHVQAAGEVKTAGSGAAADGLLQKMIFSLGMVELVSYWKITCSPRVLVQAGRLDEKQIAWWKDLYFNGLGEFFYVNQIEGAEPENFMEILADGPACPALGEASAEASDTPVRVLVPIGGGKDSVVTLELLLHETSPPFLFFRPEKFPGPFLRNCSATFLLLSMFSDSLSIILILFQEEMSQPLLRLLPV